MFFDSTIQCLYDGDGGRVQQLTPAGTTLFLGQSYEIAPDGTTTKYVFAGSQRVAAVDSTGALRYYHGDHLGSTSVVTDGAGKVVEVAEYRPYGALHRREGTTEVPQKFTGQRFDASTGFYFYNARYYDPSLGRFLQADPVVPVPGDPQALNRYSYARNNPVTYTDPSGHGWFSKFFGSILQVLGVLAAPFTGGASLWLSFAGTAWSGVQAVQAGQFGAWAAGFAVSLALGFVVPAPNFSNVALRIGVGAARGAAIGALSGGIVSSIGGGSFGEGAGYGALGGATGGATSALASSQQFQNLARGEGFLSNRQVLGNQYGQSNDMLRALSLKSQEQVPVAVGPRALGMGSAGPEHLFTTPGNNKNWEMGPLRRGGPIVTSNTTDNSVWGTAITTQNAITSGLAQTITVQVGPYLADSMALYEAYWNGQNYQWYSHNSNFAVNSVIYGAGGPEVKNLGFTPGFPDN